MIERKQLEQAITMQESLRGAVPDDVIDAAISAIRDKIAALESTFQAGQQRKQVTVLFADVSGFTAMSETMDAEDVSEIMNALWKRVDEVIAGHGGRVDKHVGDAVMAVWGVGAASEDDPERAVRAALAIQDTINDFSSGVWPKEPLRLRIGLNTGPVFLGEVGTTGEYTAMGDTVNVASRLEDAAPVGGILISQDTYRHVRGVFDLLEHEPLTVKGKEKPLQVYAVQSAKARVFRLGQRGVAGVETRMIGRDAEMRQLKDACRTSIDQCQVKMVTITGDAGVGKSRLLYEFENWLLLLPEDIWYFKGRAGEHTEAGSYFLLRDLFAFRFQILAGDPIEIVRRKMEEGVAHFLPEEGGAEQQTHMRAHILGAWLGYDFAGSPHLKAIGDNTEQLMNRGLLYLTQFFNAAAGTKPLIIFLEDIHWADRPSLEALSYLISHSNNKPLLIVALGRPLLLERQPDWGKGHARLKLKPLSEERSQELVAEILRRTEAVPQELLELIANRSEGNPFYAEELIKMLVDEEVIVVGDERWKLQRDKLGALHVPPTLTGVLQARLDRLLPPEKSALQRASVVGRTFWGKAIDYLDIDHQATRYLPTLQSRELVIHRPESTFVETDEYIFKHALLRDVTYEMVLKRNRREYHRRAGEWLASVTEANSRTEEFAAIIGEHFEAGGETVLAACWFSRAGKQAAGQFDQKAALTWLNRALAFTPETDRLERYNLLLAREKVYEFYGDREAQGKDLAVLSIGAPDLGVSEQATVALRQAHYANVTGNFPGAVAAAQDAISLVQETGDLAVTAAGYREWGNARWQQGRYAEARKQFEVGLAIALKAGEQVAAADSLRGLGLTANDQGDYAGARSYYDQCLAIYQHLGDRWGESATLTNLGNLAWNRGDSAGAERYFEQAVAITREIGHRRGESIALTNMGFVASNQGDNVGAREYFEQSLAIKSQIGDQRGESIVLTNLGSVAMKLGDSASARAYFERSLAVCCQISDRWCEGIVLNELGALSLMLGDLDEAWAYYQKALAIRKELNQSHYIFEDQAGLAAVELARGHLAQAQENLVGVINYLDENPTLAGAEHPYRAYLTCYRVLSAVGDSRAWTILEQAFRQLQEQAAGLDGERRRLFLENVPSHREIVAAWAAAEKKAEDEG